MWSQENCPQSSSLLFKAQEYIFFCKTTYVQCEDADEHCWLKVLRVCKIIVHAQSAITLFSCSLESLSVGLSPPYSAKTALDKDLIDLCFAKFNS